MKDWKKKICLGTVCLLSAPLTLAKKVLCACVPDLHINLTSRRYYEILIIVHLKESALNYIQTSPMLSRGFCAWQFYKPLLLPT